MSTSSGTRENGASPRTSSASRKRRPDSPEHRRKGMGEKGDPEHLLEVRANCLVEGNAACENRWFLGACPPSSVSAMFRASPRQSPSQISSRE